MKRQGHHGTPFLAYTMLKDTLHTLPLEERVAYAKLLAFTSRIDGELSNDEMAFFEARMGTALIPPGVRKDLRQYLKDPPSLKETMKGLGRDAALLGLRDIVLMSAADGNVDENERELLDRVAEEIGVDEEIIEDLLDWVISGYKWMRIGYKILKQA